MNYIIITLLLYVLFIIDFIEKLEKKVAQPPKTQLILRTLSADNMYLSQSFKFR